MKLKKGISCNGVIYDTLSKFPGQKFKIPEVRNLVTKVSPGWDYETIKRGLSEMTNEKAAHYPCMVRYDRGVYGFAMPETNLFNLEKESGKKEIHIHIVLER